MVHEVVTREAELELSVLGLPKSEIFEQRHVGVEESGTGQGREDNVALLARRNKR